MDLPLHADLQGVDLLMAGSFSALIMATVGRESSTSRMNGR